MDGRREPVPPDVREPQLVGTPYGLLRHLTTPVVAITTSADGRRNGFIVNSAQRASLVPHMPRISLYVSKTNFSHDLVYASGLFGVHLLRPEQFDVIEALGTYSARDVPDKLARFETGIGETGIPMLVDVFASFECRVINAMDAGGATFFLGDVVAVHRPSLPPGAAPDDVMTSPHFRANAPAPLLRRYEEGLAYAQQILEPLTADILQRTWPGPVAGP